MYKALGSINTEKKIELGFKLQLILLAITMSIYVEVKNKTTNLMSKPKIDFALCQSTGIYSPPLALCLDSA
jgi:hypothetical protein